MKTFLHNLRDTIDLVNVRRAGERFIENSSFSSVALSGASSCTDHCREAPRALSKPTDTKVGRPTHLSVTSSLTSPSELSGCKTLLPNSPPLVDAASDKPSECWAVIAIGRARRLLPWSRKSLLATKCETSKSVHGHSRRPF